MSTLAIFVHPLKLFYFLVSRFDALGHMENGSSPWAPKVPASERGSPPGPQAEYTVELERAWAVLSASALSDLSSAKVIPPCARTPFSFHS